jgi:hypothetical protein
LPSSLSKEDPGGAKRYRDGVARAPILLRQRSRRRATRHAALPVTLLENDVSKMNLKLEVERPAAHRKNESGY